MTVALLSSLLALLPRPAAAWGCEGHQAIAVLAEQLLDPATRAAAIALLRAAPIDPALPRYCRDTPDDPIVDASTWADDEREVAPATADWHFIDVPRRVDLATADYRRYCPQGRCIVDVTVHEFAIVRSTADPRARAEALRFLIHLVGDVHQPLHTITNGDRGGNCLPVRYYGHAAKEAVNGSVYPNLHAIWDSSTIRGLMRRQHLATPAALADYLFRTQHPPAADARAPTTAVVLGWAEESNRIAREVAYADLPVAVPIDGGREPATCEGNGHVARRLAELHESVARAYEARTLPVVEQQLTEAAVRLAETLRAAFATGGRR